MKYIRWFTCKVYLSAAATLLLAGISVHGQPSFIPDKINFSHLGVEDGLVNNTITCMGKDNKGFLWIGTLNGLSRYDGYEFVNYSNIPEDSTSISGNQISSILPDSRHRLWISTLRDGLNLYDPEQNNFQQIKTPNGYSLNQIKQVFEDSRGRILLATLGSGLIQYTAENGQLQVLDQEKLPGLYSNYVAGIAEDESGQLWLSHIDGGISLLSPDLTSATKYVYNDRNYDNLYHPFRGRIYYHESILWICNSPDGLIRFDPAGKKFSVIPISNKGRGLAGTDVTGIVHYSGDHYLVAIDHGGLNLLNAKTFETTYFNHNPSDPNTLANDQVISLYRDRDGIYWLGHYQGGMSYFTPSHSVFTNYVRDDTEKGLSANSVTDILEDSRHRIWIGTDGGGLDCLDASTGKVVHYMHDPANSTSLSSDLIASIYEDSNQRLWVGTFYGGLNLFDPGSGTAVRYGPGQSGNRYLNSSIVEDMVEDTNGDLWLCSLNQGIFVKRKDSASFRPVTSLAGTPLISQAAVTILEDHQRRIWIGYDDIGIYRYDLLNDSLVWFRNVPGDTGTLASGLITFIYEDRERKIWVGTPEALHLYNEKESSFYRIREDRLGVHSIHSMAQDSSGLFWIGTLSGLLRFNSNTFENRKFDYGDGLQGNEFNKDAALVGSDGTAYFGGTRGLSVFHPEFIVDEIQPPPIELTAFYLNHKKVNGPPLSVEISESEKIVLNHKQNYIGFRFTALNFMHPEKNTYAYYLWPLEKDYNFVGNQRMANYSNLDPGRYLFYVKGSNQNLAWNTTGRVIEIIIKPPFWKTIWFRLILLVILLTLFFLVYYLRVIVIKKQNIRLGKLVNEQTDQLKQQNFRLLDHARKLNESYAVLEERQQKIQEQSKKLEEANQELKELNTNKDRFFSIIAHDLKNPFNTIFGFAEMLKLKKEKITPEKRDAYIDSIYGSSQKIYNLLENLLEWSRTQNNRILFEPVTFVLKDVLTEAVELQSEHASAKRLSLKLEVEDQLQVFADRHMVSAILRNLISNAIKFTPQSGSILVTAVAADKDVVISVSDSGVGMSDEEQARLFKLDGKLSRAGTEGEEGTGLGLMLCMEFVKQNRGTIWADSKPGKGTTFAFTLPATETDMTDQNPGTGT